MRLRISVCYGRVSPFPFATRKATHMPHDPDAERELQHVLDTIAHDKLVERLARDDLNATDPSPRRDDDALDHGVDESATLRERRDLPCLRTRQRDTRRASK